MADDPLQVYRIYFIIDVRTLGFTPNETQWTNILDLMPGMVLWGAIEANAIRCENHVWHTKRAQGTALMKMTLCGFELDMDHKVALHQVVNEQAAIRGITGTVFQKYPLVLQAEIREAGVAWGLTQAQASKFIVTALNNASTIDRMAAIGAAQQYLADNSALWHAV